MAYISAPVAAIPSCIMRLTVLEECRELIRPYYLRWVYFRLLPDALPRSFSQCWDSSEPQPPDSADADPEKRDFLFLPMSDWHDRLQRTQQLALQLSSAGHRCFLLNPHLGRQFPQSPARPRPVRITQLRERIREIHVALRREPVFHHRLLTPAESNELGEAIALVLRQAGVKRLAIVCCLPTWMDAARLVATSFDCRIVYDCHDWLAGFGNIGASIVAAEPAAMAHADAVVFSSPRLHSRFCLLDSSLAAKSSILGNGVPPWTPVESPRSASFTVGYVGAIERWFDTEAVEAAARCMPGVRFLIAGHCPDPVSLRLRQFQNVELLGEIDHSSLPRFLAGLRVGIIPFRPEELIHYTDPIKLYEYFHFGLPVVASSALELAAGGDLVYPSSSPDSLVRQVYRALVEDDPAKEQARRRLAANAAWSERGKTLVRVAR